MRPAGKEVHAMASHIEGATWFDAAEIGENDRDNIGRRNAAQLFNLPNNL
jgi:predicted TIM-barrel fold metal-dependent hydrolase